MSLRIHASKPERASGASCEGVCFMRAAVSCVCSYCFASDCFEMFFFKTSSCKDLPSHYSLKSEISAKKQRIFQRFQFHPLFMTIKIGIQARFPGRVIQEESF
jgi:hypothetical protein